MKNLYDLAKCVEDRKEIPYYIVSGAFEDCTAYHTYEIGGYFNYVLKSGFSSQILTQLSRLYILELILPEVDKLKEIEQNKSKSKNAFEHTLNVINSIPCDDITMRWVGLLHDIGKVITHKKSGNFLNHSEESYRLAIPILYSMQIEQIDLILNIIRNHMIPLDYQRNPNWKDDTIERFINKIGKELFLKTIEFSYYDKKAENTNELFLDPIIELRERVLKHE